MFAVESAVAGAFGNSSSSDFETYTAGDASSSDTISRAVRRVPFAAVTGAKGCARAVDAALSGAAKSLRAGADDSESTRAVDATRAQE